MVSQGKGKRIVPEIRLPNAAIEWGKIGAPARRPRRRHETPVSAC